MRVRESWDARGACVGSGVGSRNERGWVGLVEAVGIGRPKIHGSGGVTLKAGAWRRWGVGALGLRQCHGAGIRAGAAGAGAAWAAEAGAAGSRQQEQQAAGQKSGNEQARQQAKKPKLNCLPYQRSHQKLRQKGYCKGKAPQACIVRPSHSTGVLQPPQARCLAALFVDKSGAWLEVLAGRQASCDSAPLRQTPRSFLARGRPSRLRNHLLGQRSSTRRHLRTANQRNKTAE